MTWPHPYLCWATRCATSIPKLRSLPGVTTAIRPDRPVALGQKGGRSPEVQTGRELQLDLARSLHLEEIVAISLVAFGEAWDWPT